MANTKRVQLRRGTSAEHEVFTGAEGELTIDTSKDVAVVHDGTTQGGHELVGVAATNQTIVNKDGVGIGTAIAESALTVEGDTRISGVTTVGRLIVNGIGTDVSVEVNGESIFNNNTTVKGGLFSVGFNTLTSTSPINIDASTNRITGPNATLDFSYAGVSTFVNVNILGYGITEQSQEYVVQPSVSSGSTIIGLSTISGIAVGDYITVDGALDEIKITGIITYQTETSFNKDKLVTSSTKQVSAGSTVIGITTDANIVIDDYVYVEGVFNNVPIVGITTTDIAPLDQVISNTSISTAVAAGSTVIGVANSFGVSIGSSISIFGDGAGADYSDDPLSPTQVTFDQNGLLVIQNRVGAGDTDYVTFTCPAQYPIGAIYLTKYESTDGIAFFAIQQGSTYTAGIDTSQMTVYGHFGPGAGTEEGVGYNILQGETLTNGTTYTMWIQQAGSAVLDYTFSTDAGNTGEVIEIFDRVPVVGFATVSVQPSNFTKLETNVSSAATVAAGSTVIGIAETANVSIGDSISVGQQAQYGIDFAPIVGIVTIALPYRVDIQEQTSIGSTVSIGSTIISIASTSNIGLGNSFRIAGSLTPDYVPIVGIVTDAVLISAGNTFNSEIAAGLAVTFYQSVYPSTGAVLIGAGDTSSSEIPPLTQVTISEVTSAGPAVVIGAAYTFADAIGSGVAVTFTDAIPQQSPAVLISAANTSSSTVAVGTTVILGEITNTITGVTVGLSKSTTGPISAGQTAIIEKIAPPKTDLNVNTINAVGISTFEEAIISGLRYPQIDGKRGQVLTTNADGTLSFKSAGGTTGSDTVLRVSSEEGDDINDGINLPVKSIKRATQIASKTTSPVTIFVETGEYVEDNPIMVYDSISIIGNSLRNIIVRPLNAGKDLFKVRNGCYITGLSFNDFIDERGVPQHTYDYAISFDDPENDLIDRTGYGATYTALAITGATYDVTSGFTTFTTASPHELSRENSVVLTGVGWTCGYDEVGISTFEYNNSTGVSTITFFSDALHSSSGSGNTQKGYEIGNKLYLNNLPFACSEEHAGITTTIFPDGTSPYGNVFTITGIDTAAKTVTFNAGVSTIPHIYVGYQHLGISTFEYDHVSGVATATTKEAHGFIGNDRITLENLNLSCGGYTENAQVNITNVVYNEVTGIVTVTTDSDHRATVDKEVKLAGIEFSCDSEHAGVTSTTFPYPGSSTFAVGSSYDRFVVTKVNSATEFEFNAGISTIAHTYVSGGTAQTGITTTLFPDGTSLSVSSDGYTFRVSAATTNTFTFNAGISTIAHTFEGFGAASVSSFVYTESTGVSTCVTSSNHGLAVGDYVSLDGLEFSCSAEHAGITTTIFPDGTSPYGYTFLVTDVADSTTFTINSGISTIAHTYVSGGTAQRVGTTRKVPTVQEVWYYPDYHKNGQTTFGVVSVGASNVFTIRGQVSPIQHYYTQGGTIKLGKPIINKSPYIQNCSILSSLGGNGILVDGNKVADVNKGIIPELGEIPVVGDQPEFGKSMVAATFTMISFGGIGWRTINQGYAQVVSCFQIFCRYGSLTQSGGYLSITNSATNFGDKSLRSTGFSRNAFIFDRGRISGNGTQDGLQTINIVGLGRSDQDLYVLRFYDANKIDRTSNFKPLVIFEEFNSSQVDYANNIFNIPAHPFINGESIVYNGNEDASPKQEVTGLVNDASYYVEYIDASSFRLYEDEGLTKLIDVSGSFLGINTFTKNNQEFFAAEILSAHNQYQTLTLAGSGSTANFVSGRVITQNSASGIAVTFNNTTRQLVVSVEEIGGSRIFFNDQSNITDHSASPISVGVDAVVGLSTYWTINTKVDSTISGNLISGINNLSEDYEVRLHRPSIINSSAHTWEYSGSGTDYNALPENGGQSKPGTEQVQELGGRVYASGTNELGDFKIGTQITAFNRTGNIIFNNKVTIGELASIRLSLSGGVAIEEFSTDTGLGENEVGGPQNKRVSTQLAVKSFLSNRLGSFIDKQVSTNAIPNAVVQLNAQGQINGDLIPPQIVTYTLTNVALGKTVLVNEIPAKNIKQGDTIVEPQDSFVLVNDVLGQYLILDNDTENYVFNNADVITSALTESVTGIVTRPPNGLGIGTEVVSYTGYGSTGLVKGVNLGINISNGGSGYDNAGIYTGVNLTTITGVGTDARGTITIGAGGTATVANILAGGRGYVVGDVLSVNPSDIGGRTGGADLQVTVVDVETRLYLKLTNGQKFPGTVALPDYIADGTAQSISTSLADTYTVEFDPTDLGVGGDIDFQNDTINVGVGHQFASGDPIILDANGGNLLSASGIGVLNLETYYTKPVGVSSIQLYYDYSLTQQIDLTGSGIGTHKLRRDVVNVNANKVVFVNHGFAVGDAFRVYNSAPTGITTHEFYYLGSVSSNAFTLHETQADALLSVNGVTFNPVSIANTSSGTFTLTNQNVRYSNTVNTSSTDANNYALLARDSIDASNIVSGLISPTRLGVDAANDFTFLAGDSSYKKVITSVGIETAEPFTVTSTSSALAPGGIGTNYYFGNVDIKINKVDAGTGLDSFTTLGVSKFKKSTFTIGSEGDVIIKAGSSGDVDANALQGQGPSYYLDSANHTGSVPVSRGGTGLTGVPGIGAILIGNGSAYNLTQSPIFSGNVTIPKLFINRSGNVTHGISWYSTSYTSWCNYMAAGGLSNTGPTGDITAPTGSLVTSWALRSFIENVSNYGWTWESGTASGQPSVVAELRSDNGNFRTIGDIIAAGTVTATNGLVVGTASFPIPVASTDVGGFLKYNGTNMYWDNGANSNEWAGGAAVRGYTMGGYKSSVAWLNVNRSEHATQTTYNLGDRITTIDAYTDAGSNGTYAYMFNPGGNWTAQGSEINRFNMVTETNSDITTTMNDPKDRNSVMRRQFEIAYVFGDGQPEKFVYATETPSLFSLNGNTTDQNGSHSNNPACGQGAQIGWHQASSSRGNYLDWATESWTSWSQPGSAHQSKAISSYIDVIYWNTGSGYNTTADFSRRSAVTGSDALAVSKPASTGEESFHHGEQGGFMVGMFDGNQNNVGGFMNFGTDTFTFVSSLNSIGTSGRASAAGIDYGRNT